MYIFVLAAWAWLQTGSQDPFSIRADLQGLYDEISQATLQFTSEADVDQFHDVLYTSDWVFIDRAGQRQSWSQMRDQANREFASGRLEWMSEAIQKLSLSSETATVVVNVTTVRSIVDPEGRYGPKGASHSISEVTAFRDTWVRQSDEWKMRSREQLGQPKASIDKATS